MGKIEKFSSESDLLQRIDQLKEEGVGESDLQVISEDRLDDNSLDYTDVKVKNSRGSFSDKITALFSGESAEERVLSSLNVPEEELDRYKQELNNGKILLYVDNDNISDTENYDSDHPKDSQTGNEHYDNTKPFSSDESEESGISKGTAAGAGLGAGAAGAGAAAAHSSSDQDHDEAVNEASDFDKAEREDEFNQQDEVSENDLTQDVDTVNTEKTEASSFDNEAETDRDVNTNRYGNNINEEDVAHDDVDDSNINHDGTSTSANLAGASGLGAAGYANEQREQQETEDDVQDDRRVYSSDNERDLEDLNNRETTNTSAQYGETDNVKDQRDLTREDESSFSRVHDDDVETERSSLNYNKPNESVEPPTSNETTTRESNFSSSQDEQDTNVHASEQSYNNDTQDNNVDETSYNNETQDNNVDEESVQLHEERLNVDKENVETGEASVDKHVVEEEQEFDVPVEREEVTIERKPVNEKVDEDFNANDDDSVHIPLHEERVKVDKENVVSEEIVIKKNKVQDTEHVSEKVKHEEADINNPTDDNPK
ncbi:MULTISPECIES: DUF2382 domain-containing protein [Mammaliicoccus]|uniref:DUF2382 domain-containing protein n=1 Tax=Mammaliicoccus sciuri TaxID=1296 RepID=A0AAW5LJN8_MAMSC|nr:MULTISPECIES: DUF2382 domain-containing protein [Mammaliicoccus]MBG9211252.1 DUF2382 domain-containing protein [Mammaliicoccus sciuri]MCC2090051.1 DUF2382 domain-containing protein [Mammaliicoccus sciuri]MCD5140193.1 DUF2382 domain-containing protein [Mammaliicoccus sciuri]MCI8455616.1 DUF2382 domain-containing protein [Mammaliicoccus sciuri]MCJ1759721.1 DUF2382 domain-containing protein [Mammaliicoccus sciuri]